MKHFAGHFKKAAHHHEKMAAAHLKMHEAHKAHAEHHEAMLGKAGGDDPYKEHHKASHHFHKAMAGHHEHLHKHHSAHAEHLHKMAEACASGDHMKVAELFGETIMPEASPAVTTSAAQATTTTAAAAATTATTTDTTKAAVTGSPSTSDTDFQETVRKALDSKLTEAVNSAFERVLNSGDFSKKVDEAIAGKMLEKLGQSTVPGEIRTFPVPRDPKLTSTAKEGPIDLSKVDIGLQDMLKID